MSLLDTVRAAHVACRAAVWAASAALLLGAAGRGHAMPAASDPDGMLAQAKAFYQRLTEQRPAPVAAVSAEAAAPVVQPASEKSLPSAPARPRASRLVLERALSYRGTPYLWGGASRGGLDCSGLVLRALSDLGLRAPHSAALLFGLGQPVSPGDLRPGDLVFFRNTYKPGVSHVGIVEQGSRFLHASSSAGRVTTGGLDERYFRAHFAGARRIVAGSLNRLAARPGTKPGNKVAAPLRLGLPDLRH